MACRITLKLRKFNHVSDHLKVLHWLKICERIAYKISMFVFKCKCNLSPKYLQDLPRKSQHTRSLRSSVSRYMDPCFYKNKLAKNSSFSLVGPRMWNSLPDSLKAQDNLDLFINELKTHLFNLLYDKLKSNMHHQC